MPSTIKGVADTATNMRQELINQYLRRLRVAMRHANGTVSPVAWWNTNAVEVIDALTEAQLKAAVVSDVAVTSQLALQGAPEPELSYNPLLVPGHTGDGRTVHGLVAAGVNKAAVAFDAGADAAELNRTWNKVGNFLALAGSTAISDAARASSSVSMLATPRTKYIRMVNPPTCARCLVLAGKTAHNPTMGFQRHPRCDCSQVAVYDWNRRKSHPMYQSLYFNADKYFESLSEDDQIKLVGRAGAEAIANGADMAQVINARRGMKTVTDKFGGKRQTTIEGTTVRGTASRYMRAQMGGRYVKTPGSRYRRLPTARLMPEEIYKLARGSREKSLVMLHQYGYLTDVSPHLDQSWDDPLLAEELAGLYAKARTRLHTN